MAKKRMAFEFTPDETLSSAESLREDPVASAAAPTKAIKIDLGSRSPAFRELAVPELPALAPGNRARLFVQSPNKVFFYWSLGSNPFQTLSRSFGSAGDYSLALRFVDVEAEFEQLVPIDAEGSTWFHTEAGRRYRADIGFYSPSRPFIRVLYSNTVETPRKSPSPRAAGQAEWRVPSQKFAEVLDVSGFPKDAFDVAVAGDEPAASAEQTHRAFREFTGRGGTELDDIAGEDIRYALIAIAAGRALEELRWKIGARLFALLQANADRITAARAAAALKAHFDIEEVEFEDDTFWQPVFGASVVGFPKRFRAGGYSPISSQ